MPSYLTHCIFLSENFNKKNEEYNYKSNMVIFIRIEFEKKKETCRILNCFALSDLKFIVNNLYKINKHTE